MKKICLIQQECGIGDILFCQGIANYYLNSGYRVIWPITKHITEIIPYLNSNIEFYNNEEDFPLKEWFFTLYESKKITEDKDGNIFLPLGYSSHIIEPYRSQIMQSKYSLCGLDWSVWKENLNIKRNFEKENKLFYDVLQLKDDEKFIFLNQIYCTQPSVIKKDLLKYIDLNQTKTKICELRFIEGYTLFDWSRVFEKMSAIVTVDTSLMYILEKLNLENTSDYICFTRNRETESEIKNLFKTPWKYIHA